MSVLSDLEQVNEFVAFCALLTMLVGLALAFAPPMPARRVPALARRMRDTARH